MRQDGRGLRVLQASERMCAKALRQSMPYDGFSPADDLACTTHKRRAKKKRHARATPHKDILKTPD